MFITRDYDGTLFFSAYNITWGFFPQDKEESTGDINEAVRIVSDAQERLQKDVENLCNAITKQDDTESAMLTLLTDCVMIVHKKELLDAIGPFLLREIREKDE